MLDEKSGSAEREITALDPRGIPPVVTGKSPAPRLESLDGKTVFLVDSRFDDSAELLKQIEAWFAANMPSTTTHLVSLSGTYAQDDPALWERIQSEGHAAIVGVGHCSTCAPAVSTHAVTLETKYGVPTVAVHTDKFVRVVQSVTRMAGLPQAPLVFVPQPVMGRSAAELADYVAGVDPVSGRPVMQGIIEGLSGALPSIQAKKQPAVVTSAQTVSAVDEEALQNVFLDNNWTDMLPIVVPTEARVAAMLAGTSRSADEIVGQMQPTKNRGLWSYTVKNVAVNAVMAGAKPAYFPVILALAASGISARGSSSSSAATMTIVNGPIRDEIGMNCGIGALGPYSHANATIGRAYSLLSQNLQGGSVPDETFMGSLGSNYTYNGLTFAENEERSPWEPLHVQKGFEAAQSTVSIFSGCRSTTFCLGLREKNWQAHVKDMLLGTDAITAPVLVLDPIAARQFVERGGFENKADLIAWVHDTARMPASRYWDLQLVQNYIYPRATFGEAPFAERLAAGETDIHIFREEEITVVVAGGEANGYWQIYGARPQATVLIDDWR